MNLPDLPTPPVLKTEDKLCIVLSHLSLILGAGIVIPLIIYLVKKGDSTIAAFHAKEALNFHLSLYLYALACVPLVFVLIGVPLLMVLGVGGLILSIIATVRSADGAEYRYPLTIRFV